MNIINFKSDRKRRSAHHEPDLEAIIAGCIAQNSQAQRMLYKQFFTYAKSICMRYSSDGAEVDDILNEGFLKVFTHLKEYNSTYPLRVWIRTIMINTAISYYRKNKKHHEKRTSYEDAPYLGFEEDIVSTITADEILVLIRQIKPKYKNVFLLYVVDGYNHREIAELMEIKEATVRSHYVRARMHLQQLIKQNYPHLFPAKSMRIKQDIFSENIQAAG